VSNAPLLCPSAQPEQPDARVFGVQTATADNQRRVGYLTETVPVTEELMVSLGQTSAPEVLRIAAPCMHGACAHFEGGACALAGRVARMLGPVVSALPRCAIRPSCRWFREQGPAACVRCPQVVTNSYEGSGVPATVAYRDGMAPDYVSNSHASAEAPARDRISASSPASSAAGP
jgi:hypothetical protein